MTRNYDKAGPAEFQRIPDLTRDDEWIKQFLQQCKIGHIAHSRAEQPFITPTNFWFDEEKRRIIFHSNIAGRMRDNLEHNPRVCMESSEYGRFLPANTALEFSLQYRSVMVFGVVSILDNPEEKNRSLEQIVKKVLSTHATRKRIPPNHRAGTAAHNRLRHSD